MSQRIKKLLQNFSLSLLLHLAVFGLLVWWLRTPPAAMPREIELDLSREEAPPMVQAEVAKQESGINYQEVSGGSPWLIPRMGDYVSASVASQKPMWVDGLFGYYSGLPKSALPPRSRQDSHYVVMVEAYIDTQGKVQGSHVVMGGYEGLNKFIEEKVRSAHFEPALDAHRQPMMCKMTFPIDVEIMDKGDGSGYQFKSK